MSIDGFLSALRAIFGQVQAGVGGLPGEERRPFAARLIVRLLFLRFLERRGWLGGDRDFLARHMRRVGPERFLEEALRPLCLEALRLPPALRGASALALGELAALNRRLFAPAPGWEDGRARVAGEVFELIFERLLAPYELDARAPAEGGAALGPDLLGRCCEALVADRHGKGAFYTLPDEIRLMCREALIAHLAQRCPWVAPERIAALVYCEPGAAAQLAPGEAGALSDAVLGATVCDPAVGAGALAAGMLRHMSDALRELRCAGAAGDDAFALGCRLAGNIYGCDIDEAAVECARLRLWLELVAMRAGAAPLPDLDGLRVGEALGGASESIDWQREFPAIFAGAHPGFDIVVGNPPYLRQEQIGARARKQMLKRSYGEAIGHPLSGKSDLYVYFFLRGMLLLRRRGGVLCMLSSNAWLDVAYGDAIRRALAERADSCWIYDSQAARSFDEAAINTTITLARLGEQTSARGAAFVLFKAPYGAVRRVDDLGAARGLAPGEERDTPLYRARGVALAALRGGAASGWGGRHLRAPEIVRRMIERRAERFTTLGAIAELRFGVKTGANGFFHLDERTIQAWEIEPEYLRPLIHSARECRSIVVDPRALSRRLLVCRRAPEELAGTKLLAYLRWGERQGYHRRPSCRSRRRWYDLGEPPPSDFLLLRFRDARSWTPLLPQAQLAVGDTLFTGTVRDRRHKGVVGGLLNSTLHALMTEIHGRANLGDGLLTTYGPELAALPIPRPELALAREPELERCLAELARRPVLPLPAEIDMPDRRALDAIVFDILELGAEERDATYSAVVALAEMRRKKADGARRDA